MKWSLSILSKNELAGFVDCSLDRKKKRFIVKEINIQKGQRQRDGSFVLFY